MYGPAMDEKRKKKVVVEGKYKWEWKIEKK
jgi:hypothetical protein